jgi:hypothetical protein
MANSQTRTPQATFQAEVGRIAAGMLLDRIRSDEVHEPQRVLVPNEFIARASIGAPPQHLAPLAGRDRDTPEPSS